MTRLDSLFAVFFLAVLLFLAPSGKAQGTYNASSCNLSDVNAVINGPTHTAVDGDTINIPAGTCTWTGGITVPGGIGITIIGNGSPNSTPATTGASSSCSSTVIVSNGGMFSFHPRYGASLSRLSCMKFLVNSTASNAPVGAIGTCTSSGCPNFRMDNITAPTAWSNGSIPDATFSEIANVFGVEDHNTIGDVQSTKTNGVVLANVGHGSWMGVGNWGDNSWASPDTFGTNQAFYLENNVFNNAMGTDTDTFAAYAGGGRFVCRFNQFNGVTSGGACTDHGTDTSERLRGGRQWEAYYNTGTCSDATLGCATVWPWRSGVGRSFANSFSNVGGGFLTGLSTTDAQRRWRPDTPWGACDGTSPWDANDGVVYYTGTIGSVTSNGGTWTITASGSPSWTPSVCTGNYGCLSAAGAPYSYHNTSVNNSSFAIDSNTANSFTSQWMCINGCTTTSIATGQSYQILRASVCMDQPARGAGILVTGPADGTNPVLSTTGRPGPVNQILDPTYEAADVLPSSAVGHATIGQGAGFVYYRDVYAETVNQTAQTSPTSPFNGGNGDGAGHGTGANRPTNCTTGAGYWATDQGTWNTYDSTKEGVLYVCTAPNTWALQYEPYTYPHPLIAGGSTGTGQKRPNPPAGLAAVVQ